MHLTEIIEEHSIKITNNCEYIDNFGLTLTTDMRLLNHLSKFQLLKNADS